MFEKERLSVHLLKSALIMYYENKDTIFVQRKENFENEDLEKSIITMIEKMEERQFLKKPEKVHTYITLPQNLIRTSTMLSMPMVDNLKGKKLTNVLELFTENALDLHIENPIYDISILKNFLDGNNYMSVSVIDEEKVSLIPEILFNKDFRIRSIEPEADSVRRYAIKKEGITAKGGNVIIHFFYDGEEMNVGFYIYEGDFLCGHRYLPLDVYSHEVLMEELTVVLSDCKRKFQSFEVNNYCIISEREKDYVLLKPYFEGLDVNFIQTKYATNEGAILMHSKNKPAKKRSEQS